MEYKQTYLALLFVVFGLYGCNPNSGEVVGAGDGSEINSNIYDYLLEDINSTSVTYGTNLSPASFPDQVTLHYFGHQNWGTCSARVGNLNDLYQDLLNAGIDNVKIITIGKSQYSSFNTKWTNGNYIPVIVDPSPYNIWSSWGSQQRDLFFLDSNGNYVTNFNISTWDYDKIYSTILDISSQ